MDIKSRASARGSDQPCWLARGAGGDWRLSLAHWAEAQLERGETGVLDQAMPQIEKLLIQVALKHSGGHKQDAAKLLGWGRNTLTRKLKELGM